MVKPIIAILGGKVATGKSTAFANLKKNKKMSEWIFIDHPALKAMFEYLGKEGRKKYGKEVMFAIMKVFMKEKKNILVEEFSRDSFMKNISKEVKKYGYEFRVFQFDTKLESSVRREAKRRKAKGKKPFGREWVKKWHEFHEKNADPKGIIVNTSELGKRQVVNLIMRELKV